MPINLISLNTAHYLGFYNGMNVAGTAQGIGYAISEDRLSFSRSALRLLEPRTGLFDNSHLNAPCPVQVGDLIYLFYAGYNSNYRIGLAILTKDLQVISRPRHAVLDLGAASSWDDTKIFRPFVLYNSNAADSNKRFTMFYNGANSGGVNQQGIAYSPDGLTWTKYGSNPILSPGSAGAWDDAWVLADWIILVGSTYYMFYNGYDGSTAIQTGVATAPSLEGPWTKDAGNPILSSRASATQNLTADASAGATTLSVTDSSVFEVDEPCFLTASTGTEDVRVKSKPNGTTIELYEPIIAAYTTANSAKIVSMLQKSVGPNQVVYENGLWKVYGSAWSAVSGYEVSTLAEGSGLNALQWSYANMPVLNYDSVVTANWDSKSQENLKFIYQPY